MTLANLRVLQRWRHRCVRPALDSVGWRARQAEAFELASLAAFIQCHPDLDFSQNVHASRLPSSAVTGWTLARCGHHPFLDGAARRRGLNHPGLCGCDDWSLLHALRTACARALFFALEAHMAATLANSSCNWDVLSDDSLLRLVFALQEMGNTRSSMIAHVVFLASICRAQRSLLEGLES